MIIRCPSLLNALNYNAPNANEASEHPNYAQLVKV